MAQRWDEGTSMPPLGILSLAAVLEQKGMEVDVVPADILGYNWKDVEQRIKDFNPDIVGGTTTTENRFDSFKLAETTKRINPDIVTILGGPHISMVKEDTMRHIPDVDMAVIGEGETTVLELAQTLEAKGDVSSVKGIYYRKSGQILFSGNRDNIKDLDLLPYPARHMIPMEKYNFYVTTPDGKKWKAQNIMTSRGCPFACYFCATPTNWGRKMRGHSPERVADEIEHLILEYGAEYIWFYDDTLNYNLSRLHRIMDLIIERKFNIKFCNEFRIDLVDESLLEKMVKAGLVWGHFGIEAGSARVRRDIVGKKFDVDTVYRFVRLAKKIGFVPDAFLIFSHYTETWEEAQETIHIMEELKAINPETEFATAILHVYPGTPLEEIARKEGVIPGDFSWSRKQDLKKVAMLPAAQGNVPLFKDKLTWFQIAELVMQWSADKKRMISGAKIKAALKTLSSWKSFKIYAVFFLTIMRFRLKRLFKPKAKGESK